MKLFRKIVFACVVLSFSLSIFAQKEKCKLNNEQLQKEQLAYVSKELQLTKKEQENFIPLYKELLEKQKKLFHRKRKLVRNFNNNRLNMSEKELLASADEFVAIDKQRADADAEYNEKFKTVLPPLKLMLFYLRRHDFKKQLLRRCVKSRPDAKN